MHVKSIVRLNDSEDKPQEPITLEEAKKHLRLESFFDDDDDLIQGLIESVREQAESLTHQLYTPCVVTVLLSARGCYWLNGLTPVHSNEPVLTNSTLLTFGKPAEFKTDAEGEYVFNCGHTPASVPRAVKSWMLLRLAALYEQRASHAEKSVQTMGFVDSLLRAHYVPNYSQDV